MYMSKIIIIKKFSYNCLEDKMLSVEPYYSILEYREESQKFPASVLDAVGGFILLNCLTYTDFKRLYNIRAACCLTHCIRAMSCPPISHNVMACCIFSDFVIDIF